MFDAYTAGISYRFSSNGLTLLPELAGKALATATALDTLATSFTGVKTASTGVATRLRSINKAFSGIDRAAVSTAFAFDNSMANMDASVTATAAKVDTSSVLMVNGLRDINLNARAAAAGIASVGTAATATGRAASRFGAGAAAGGAGGAAGHSMSAGDVVGLGALATLAGGIKGAGDFQNSILQTAIANGKLGPNMGATMQNMQPTIAQAYAMSANTGGSVNDMAAVISGMASSGFNNQQIAALNDPMSRLLDILHFNPKDNLGWREGSAMVSGLTHDLHIGLTKDPATNARETHALYEALAQADYLSPHPFSQLSTQIRRYAPTFMGELPGDKITRARDSVMYANYVDRMGMLNFGGSALDQAMTTLATPRGKAAVNAQIGLGLRNADGTSKFRNAETGAYEFPLALEQIQKSLLSGNLASGQHVGDAKIQDLITQLGPRNAARVFRNLGSADAKVAFQNLQQQRSHMSSLEQIQSQLMDTLPHAFTRLQTNIESLATALGGPFVQPLANFVGKMAEMVGSLTTFLNAHKSIMKAVDVGLGVLALGGIGTAFKFLGGASIFGHMFLHNARNAIGVGASVAIPRNGSMLAHTAGGLMRGGNIIDDIIGGLFGGLKLTALRGLGASLKSFSFDFKGLGMLFQSVRIGTLGTRGVFALLGDVMMKFGLRAIPVIGEIMMLWDAISFLGKHSRDIGYMVGYAAAWIKNEGAPMMGSALKDMVKSAWKGLNDPALGKELEAGLRALLVSIITGGGYFDKTGEFVGGGADAGAAAEERSKNPLFKGHYTRDKNGKMIWHAPRIKPTDGGGFGYDLPKGSFDKRKPPPPPPKKSGRTAMAPSTVIHVAQLDVHPRSDEHIQAILESVHRQAKMGGVGTATHQSDSPAVGGTTMEVNIS